MPTPRCVADGEQMAGRAGAQGANRSEMLDIDCVSLCEHRLTQSNTNSNLGDRGSPPRIRPPRSILTVWWPTATLRCCNPRVAALGVGILMR